MIDLKLLRENTAIIKELILRKEPNFPIDPFLALDSRLRTLSHEVEVLRKERNEFAFKGAGGVTPELREQSVALGKKLKAKEKELEKVTQDHKTQWLSCPNLLQSDVPAGGKEANRPIKFVGEKPSFNFTPKNHLELNEELGWFDFDSAAAMSGSQFVVYRKDGVKLLYALTQLMLKNNVSYGFEPVVLPYLVKDHALVNSGNLPKFKGDFYTVPDDGLNLIPTAEVSLTNLHAKSILNKDELPLRYTAWASCFRREAGGYGSTERGLIRIHQFEKVELYTICEPEKSNEELDRMVSCAQTLLDTLGLHYRISLLAAQDCSFSSALTYDIEVWLPGQKAFYEVSSASNCTDFQARRAGIRYRPEAQAKPKLAHTLNASSLALPRLMIALIEQYQQADGSVKLPPVLQEAMNAVW